MTGKTEWEGTVGFNWAAEWQRTDRSFAGLTSVLLDRIAALPGRRIVDIGCGAGELSLAIARARPGAQVTGVDVSASLVEASARRGADCGNARFLLADAGAWSDPDGAPDLYVSRHGVMFFPDPPAAFAHLARVAAPNARIAFSCFREAAQNAWAGAVGALLPQAGDAPADPFAPGPFAFADPDHVRRVMEPGWRDIAFEPVDFAYVAGEGDDPVADAMDFFQRIGPAAAAMRALPETEQAAFRQRLRAALSAFHRGDQVVFPAAAWIVTATVDPSKR